MTAPAIKIADVHKSFGATRIIRGVSLTVPAGQRHAIIGPNGAGKSTLFNLISGRLSPTSGKIELNGEDVTGLPPYQINRRGLSRSFQVTNIFPRLSVWENVRCAVLWSLGYRYAFWRGIDGLADVRVRTEHILAEIDLIDRRARHGRRVRPRRPHLRAGVRADHRQRRAGGDQTGPRRADRLSGRRRMILEVRDLHAYYGKSHILQGVSLNVGAGEIVSILGRNGVGRSTTLKAIMGDVPPHGSIVFKDEPIAGLKPYEIAHRGIGYVPEDRAIFPTLTVEQNLILGRKAGRKATRWGFGDAYRLFPRLEEMAATPAGVISGGEQQMLTICRALMGDPDLIMIDEPTEGLAPQMVERIAGLLKSIAERHISILLVEQKLTIAMRISHRVYVMGHGRVVFEGTPAELAADEAVRHAWLEV
jgi:branched-chain amino acid transport system ATP-binding protein